MIDFIKRIQADVLATRPAGLRPLREVRKEYDNAWVKVLDKWRLFTALDTVTMDNYCKDALNNYDDCPAIGIERPPFHDTAREGG
ncbi:MAG: hypothetical protein WAL34_04190 [Acidobacteriaceae bacterium]